MAAEGRGGVRGGGGGRERSRWEPCAHLKERRRVGGWSWRWGRRVWSEHCPGSLPHEDGRWARKEKEKERAEV